MTFPRIRANWTANAVPTHQEFNTWDQDHANSVDGAAGGAYSPTSPIVLGASGGNLTGLHVTAILQADQLNATVASGQNIILASGGELVAQNGATIAVSAGAQEILNGQIIANSGALIELLSGAAFTQLTGAAANFNGATTFGASSFTSVSGSVSNPAVWAFGANSALSLTGIPVSDASIWTKSGGSVEYQTGTLTTFDAGSVLSIKNTPLLAMTQPAANAAPGANVLYSTSQIKAWGKLATDGAGNVALVGTNTGFNVGSVACASSSVVLQFATPMGDAHYVVTGIFASPSLSSATTFGIVVGFNPAPGSVALTAVPMNSMTPVNLSTTGGVLEFVVLGRQ